MNNITTIYLCEDCIDGIFTAIYYAWSDGICHTDVRLKDADMNYSFFEKYEDIQTDTEISLKVSSAIKNKLSPDIYEDIFCVSLIDNVEKASVIYHFLQQAFQYGISAAYRIQNEYVFQFSNFLKKIRNEAHFYIEISRFEELSNHVLICRIEPDDNIIYLIVEHFVDRLHCEDFIICDIKRDISAIHRKNKGYSFISGYHLADTEGLLNLSDSELAFRDMWRQFYNTIAIKERTNARLQKNMLPLKYRKHMTEM